MVLEEIERSIKYYILDHPAHFTTEDSLRHQDAVFNTIDEFDIFLADYFDVVAGISAGSWMGAYVATKGGFGSSRQIFSMPHIVNKYGSIRPGSMKGLEVYFIEYHDRIYPPPISPIQIIPQGPFKLPKVAIPGLTKSNFEPEGLEWLLGKFLGNTKLSEVATTTFVIAFDLSRMAAVEFIADYFDLEEGQTKPDFRTVVSSTKVVAGEFETITSVGEITGGKGKKFESARTIEDLDYYVKDIVRASSAFPILHRYYKVIPINDVTNYFNMVDGALTGNNPTLPALAYMLGHKNLDFINQTAVISIGTGFQEGSYEEMGTAGALGWSSSFLNVVGGIQAEYIHALVDFIYYDRQSSVAVNIKPNQLIRIQIARDIDSPEGRLMSGFQGRVELQKLKELSALNAQRYRDNIDDFVETFLMAATDDMRPY